MAAQLKTFYVALHEWRPNDYGLQVDEDRIEIEHRAVALWRVLSTSKNRCVPALVNALAMRRDGGGLGVVRVDL